MTPKLRHRNLLAALAGAAMIAGVTVLPTASAQSACDALGGKVDADPICQVHSATPTYTIDMSFPLDYPDQQAMADFLTQDRDGFLDWIAKFGGQSRNRQYMHDVSAKTYRSSGTQSLVLDIDDDTGLSHEDHPGTSYRAFNYGTNPLAVLNPIVQRELGKHSYTPVQDLDATTYRNFAITDDAVLFFFGEDEAVADNNGPHQVSVPRSELAALLA